MFQDPDNLDFNYETVYAHLNTPLVELNQKITGAVNLVGGQKTTILNLQNNQINKTKAILWPGKRDQIRHFYGPANTSTMNIGCLFL